MVVFSIKKINYMKGLDKTELLKFHLVCSRFLSFLPLLAC